MQQLQTMLESHPSPAHSDGDVARACIEACYECAAICATCADACLAEENAGELVMCIRLNLDCADVCAVTGRLFARPSARDVEALRLHVLGLSGTVKMHEGRDVWWHEAWLGALGALVNLGHLYNRRGLLEEAVGQHLGAPAAGR